MRGVFSEQPYDPREPGQYTYAYELQVDNSPPLQIKPYIWVHHPSTVSLTSSQAVWASTFFAIPFSGARHVQTIRKKIKRRCREMKMGAQIRTGKRLPDTGKRFRGRIWAYVPHRQLLFLFVFSISIGKSFSGTDLYPHFHFQITVEPPRLIFFLSPPHDGKKILE